MTADEEARVVMSREVLRLRAENVALREGLNAIRTACQPPFDSALAAGIYLTATRSLGLPDDAPVAALSEGDPEVKP